MYSIVLNTFLIIMAVCISVITIGATIMMVKDFKDDMR